MKEMFKRMVFLSPDDGTGGGTLLTGEGANGNGAAAVNKQGNTPANDSDNGGKGTQANGWLTTFKSEVREKYGEALSSIGSNTNLANEYFGLKEKMDSAIFKPGEDATPEQVAAYRKSMGIPESADGYELAENEIVGDEMRKNLSENYLKYGLNSEQAKNLYDDFIKMQQNGMDRLRQENVKAREESVTQLKSDWSDNYDANMEFAHKGFEAFATPELRKYMEDTGLGNNPEVVKMFYNMYTRVGNDSLLSPTGSQNQELPEARQRFPNSPQMWK